MINKISISFCNWVWEILLSTTNQSIIHIRLYCDKIYFMNILTHQIRFDMKTPMFMTFLYGIFYSKNFQKKKISKEQKYGTTHLHQG